jgi:ubiquinone/menaquinone biosynthesis C-methylase UbiE
MSNPTQPALTFTGSIPQHYDQYQGPMFFEDYAIDVANRIDVAAARDVLELSCGTGRVTNHIRRVLSPASRLIASDLSPEMLEVAKQKLTGSNIEWQIIDFTKIPFKDNSLDLVVCCFGYMFAENKEQAFAEAFRVLRNGGSLLIATWDKLEYNEASYVFRKTVKKYLVDSLPAMYTLPFSMNDADVIKHQLGNAGFSGIKTDLVEKKSVCESAKHATYGMVNGGTLYNEIIKRNPAWVNEISDIVEKELSEKYGSAPMIAPMRALITQAWKS